MISFSSLYSKFEFVNSLNPMNLDFVNQILSDQSLFLI